MNLLKKEITSPRDIINYINYLTSQDLLYHFDDDAEDVLCRVSNHSRRLFTKKQCELVNKRRDEMLSVDYEFAFDYACTKLE